MKSKSAAMSPRATLMVFIAAVVLIGGATMLPLIVIQNITASASEAK